MRSSNIGLYLLLLAVGLTGLAAVVFLEPFPAKLVVGAGIAYLYFIFRNRRKDRKPVLSKAERETGSSQSPVLETDISYGPDEPVVVPIQDFVDLHTFSPREIPRLVRDYLEEAHRKGYREVRIIHGRGTGFQRERVREVLAAHDLVSDYRDAPPERGGWGATLAFLRERRGDQTAESRAERKASDSRD